MGTYLQQLATHFKNLTLNAMGVERDIYRLIEDKDITKVISMMQNRDDDVDEAIKEYNPQTHKVMSRPNKSRKSTADYITEKLPRSRQRYINEVELFFLLGHPIVWKKESGDDDAYTLFTDFLKSNRFNTDIRKAKRIAGSETEAAKLYHIYRDEKNGEISVKPVILARSTGYQLRPLFDQYHNMTAFAYGYRLKENGKTVQHWDIQTSDMLFYCKQSAIGWEVTQYRNPTGKINIIYYQQPKAWAGAEPRIHREEMLDSKVGDENNYFADPIAAASADVIESMLDPERPGKLIQLSGEGSRFSYINPPQSSETRSAEKKDLNDSILFDTMTPDFSFDNLRGMGTLTGAAIKNAMILGYIKRDNLIETYGELVDREKNIIFAILKYLHPEKAKKIDELNVSFQFGEPFEQDKQTQWTSISNLYQAGLLSLEQAVALLSLTDAPEEEVERIRRGRPAENEGAVEKPSE